MKRIASLLIVLVLAFSLVTTAFAAETGTITITNATPGDTYTLYKIFNASASETDEDAVAYTITTDNQFFAYLFGADGKSENPFFIYNAANSSVVRKEGTENQNKALFDYLTEMIRDEEQTWTYVKEATAESKTVLFEDLDEGYYLIDKDTGTAVTITSNKPDAVVIDKNQSPGEPFSKLIYDVASEEWVSSTTGSIGAIEDFKVEFAATNYDGENQIKYYTVKDQKGSALWVEFGSVTVTIDGVPQSRGYYHCTNPDPLVNTGEWTYLGDWGDTPKEPNNAQWYLIHHGYDEFDIVIPWMSNHIFTQTGTHWALTFGEGTDSYRESPLNVVIEYFAYIEPDATIGSSQNNNLWNTATLSWTSTITDSPDEPSSTGITVYALGLEKIDGDTGEHLPGAVFGVYRDVDCTNPVYVIPTDIKGIYMLDDENLSLGISGNKRVTPRKLYADYLEAYLGPNYATTQKNEVTSQENGKLIILGLAAGDYYLREITAPDGYNVLPAPELVQVGSNNSPFEVYVDADGNMVDEEAEDFATSGAVRHSYIVTHAKVENNIGMELPSTGGEGTMMLITLGSLIAMAFAVLLITHKKMSIYHD